MADQAVPASSSDGFDVQELGDSVISLLATALIIVSAVAWLLVTPGKGFRLDRFLVFVSLFVQGIAIYTLRSRGRTLVRTILLLGPPLSLALALRVFPQYPLVPGFALLAVIANAAISPPLGVAAAALNTLPILLLSPSPREAFVPLVLLWLGAGTLWISSRSTYTALQWAWNSQQRASTLLEELRERRGELRRTVDALTEATRRLQRTGYELAVARLRADEARRLKEQFAANISHELRTPLNLILGFAEIMYYTPEVYGDLAWPQPLRSDVRQIYLSSRQLLDLVNDVIDLARIDVAQMPVHKEPSDIRTIVQETVTLMQGLVDTRRGASKGPGSGSSAHRPELELRVQSRAEVPLLELDRARIRQVLLNLLNNAIRFTEAGSVTVSIEVHDRELVLTVADTGTGISPEELPRIFDEFYQVDMSLRRRREGSGLGLAISKRFVELHGGRIWAESQLGVGSVFHFSLPLTPDGSLMPLSVGAASCPTEPARSNVLVIDGDPGVATMMGRHLAGRQVLQARELGEASHVIGEQRPQGVILNVSPGHDPSASLQELLALLPDRVPGAVCSLPSQSWLVGGDHIVGILSKPVSREQLLQALGAAPAARHLLVVDDDRGFVQYVRRLLEGTGAGYEISWALEGEEGLAKIEARRPDLILLDMAMPRMGGAEMLERLRADPATSALPVLIVTATDQSNAALAQRAGGLALGIRGGLSTGEVIKCLQAVLGVLAPMSPTGSSPRPATTGRG